MKPENKVIPILIVIDKETPLEGGKSSSWDVVRESKVKMMINAKEINLICAARHGVYLAVVQRSHSRCPGNQVERK